MLDGGVFTIPLAITVIVAVLGAMGGAAGGCYATTGDWRCRADDAKDFPTSNFDACNGTEDRVYASWRPTQSSSQAATVTIKAAHTHSRSWARSVQQTTASGTARFTLDVVGGAAWFITRAAGVPVPIGHMPTGEQSLSVTYDLMTEESDSLTVTCPPGIVWQWTIEMSRCGEPTSAVGTRNVRCTPNLDQPPCCMPGYEMKPQDPFAGGCLKTSSHMQTRLRSPMCQSTKHSVDEGGNASIVDYNERLAHYAMHLHDATPVHRPVAAGALLGVSLGMLSITVLRRTLLRRTAALM